MAHKMKPWEATALPSGQRRTKEHGYHDSVPKKGAPRTLRQKGPLGTTGRTRHETPQGVWKNRDKGVWM